MLTAGQAQTAITSIATSNSKLANSTSNGRVFENSTLAVSSFTTSSATYNVAGNAISAAVRRNNVTSNNSSAWYAQGTPNTESASSYSTDYASLLLGNNLLRGSDNTFANGATVSDGNIERLDFILSNSGITATAGMAFAIFDRGAVNAHDAVQIALITSLGTITVNSVTYTNAPTNYGGNLVSVTSTNYGANVVGDFSYNLMRYNTGDNLSSWSSIENGGPQGIGGTVVNLTDFNVAPGSVIYGYSLFAGDVTVGANMATLADWSTAARYPTATSGSGAGGIDLAAVNGVQFQKLPVPESSTYGLILIGATLCFVGFRRRQNRLAA